MQQQGTAGDYQGRSGPRRGGYLQLAELVKKALHFYEQEYLFHAAPQRNKNESDKHLRRFHAEMLVLLGGKGSNSVEPTSISKRLGKRKKDRMVRQEVDASLRTVISLCATRRAEFGFGCFLGLDPIDGRSLINAFMARLDALPLWTNSEDDLLLVGHIQDVFDYLIGLGSDLNVLNRAGDTFLVQLARSSSASVQLLPSFMRVLRAEPHQLNIAARGLPRRFRPPERSSMSASASSMSADSCHELPYRSRPPEQLSTSASASSMIVDGCARGQCLTEVCDASVAPLVRLAFGDVQKYTEQLTTLIRPVINVSEVISLVVDHYLIAPDWRCMVGDMDTRLQRISAEQAATLKSKLANALVGEYMHEEDLGEETEEGENGDGDVDDAAH